MLNHPIEYALVGFKGNKFSGKIVPELLDLSEQRRLQAIVDDNNPFFHSRRP